MSQTDTLERLPEGQEETNLGPLFALSVWDVEGEPGEVDLRIHHRLPMPDTIAPQGTLYGLAIMVLEQQGTIAATIDRLLANGPISAVSAYEMINLLMEPDANDQPV